MPAAFSWFLAARYLVTRRVNALGVGGVAVAVWALIVVIAVFSGFIGEIRDSIRTSSPELMLTNLDPDRHHSYQELREIIEADRDVVATAPRLTHYGIYYPADRRGDSAFAQPQGFQSSSFDFVTLLGIDSVGETRVTNLARWLQLPPSTPPSFAVEDHNNPFDVSPGRLRMSSGGGAIIAAPGGILLAFDRISTPRLRSVIIRPGTVIDVVSANEQEDHLRSIRWRMVLSGGFETGHRLFDDGTAIIDIEELRTILGHDIDRPGSIDLVTAVAIRPRPGADLEALTERLTRACAELGGGQVLTWEDQNSVFLGAVDQERGMMKLVLFAVMLVAAFLVYATLHMMVTQKTKDIGILSSMGATEGAIQTIFLLCGLAVSALGCTLGATFGYLSVIWLNPVNDWMFANFQTELFPRRLYNMDEVPYQLEGGWILTVILAAVILSLLVAWLPARRAARMEPVRALSYE